MSAAGTLLVAIIVAGLSLQSAWQVAHEAYARNGLVDPDAPVQAAGQIVVHAAPDDVWNVLADVRNWPRIRSDIHDMKTDGLPAPDVAFTRSTSGVSLTSRFGKVEPGRELSWTTFAPGLLMVHHYVFEPVGSNSVRIVARESMDAPAAPQIDDKELESRIRSWLEGIRAVAEAGPRDDQEVAPRH